MDTHRQNAVFSRIWSLALVGCLFFGCAEESGETKGDEKEEPSKEDEKSESDAQSENDAQSESEDESDKSSGDGGSGKEPGEDGGNEAEPKPGEMHIKFKTASPKGKYAPRNVGAVWVEDESGEFVRTIKVWAKKRAVHLVQWQKSSGADRTDAISSATIKSHRSHAFSWDLKDAKGKQVKPGSYVLRFEITDRNSSSKSIDDGPDLSIPFELGAEDSELEIPEHKNFRDLEVKLPEPETMK